MADLSHCALQSLTDRRPSEDAMKCRSISVIPLLLLVLPAVPSLQHLNNGKLAHLVGHFLPSDVAVSMSICVGFLL